MCLQTIRLLVGQLTVYTDGSVTDGTRDGGARVNVTCGDLADPTIPHRSQRRGVAFTSSCAEEAAEIQFVMEWATASHPDHSLTICTDSQSLLRSIEFRSPVTHHLRSILNTQPGSTALLWVTGYKGILGDELAPKPKQQFSWSKYWYFSNI